MININSKTYRLQIFDKLVTESEFGMPIIPKYKGEIPENCIRSIRRLRKRDTTVHLISI